MAVNAAAAVALPLPTPRASPAGSRLPSLDALTNNVTKAHANCASGGRARCGAQQGVHRAVAGALGIT